MERKLHYHRVLLLKEITLRSVIAYLWNGSIFDTNGKLRDVWDIFEGDVKGKVSKLKLPRSIENQMMNLVKPIGSDILNWQVYHENNFVYPGEVFNVNVLQYLQRKCTGLIDYRRTAGEIVSHEMFDVNKCFELACLYCLEGTISLLWGKFSEEDKESILRRLHTYSLDVTRKYWFYILTDQKSYLKTRLPGEPSLSAFYNYAIDILALNGNKSSTEYFFQKLKKKKRVSSLFLRVVGSVLDDRFQNARTEYAFSTENSSDVLCYLLSVMTSKQKIEVCKEYSFLLLICLLDWQFESIFFDIADLCWRFLPKGKHVKLLYNIRVFITQTGYYVPKMFQNFFLSSPPTFKKLFVELECHKYYSRSIFSEFLRAEDTGTIESIFGNIDVSDRVNLVFSEEVSKTLSYLIFSGRWQAVEVCLRKVKVSDEDREALVCSIRYFMAKLSIGLPAELRRQKLKEFLEFIDEIFGTSSNIKREIDEIHHKFKELYSGERGCSSK